MMRLLKMMLMKLAGMPSCQDIEQFAYSYLDKTLDPTKARRFERHLQGCRQCTHFVESYRAVANPGQMAQPIPLDPEFEARVVDFLIQNRQ